MKRPAQIAIVAFLAVLVSSVAIACPKQAWATDRFEQLDILGEAENIGRATWGYSGRSWTTFGSLVGKALALVPTTSGSAVNNSLPDKNKSDSRSRLSESEVIVKEIFLSSQFLVSEANLVELRWNDSSPSAVLATTHVLLDKLGDQNDLSTEDSIFGRALFLDEVWNWEAAHVAQGQILAIRENLFSLQNEVEVSGLTPEAFEKLNLANRQLEGLEAVIGVEGDTPAAMTLFGQLSQTKSEKFDDSADKSKSVGDFTTNIEHLSWS